MNRPGPAPRLDVLFTALTVTLGLQTLRAFLPLVVYVYGARPGVTSVDMGLLATAVFATGFLAAIPQRLLGPRRALRSTATVLAASRLLAQLILGAAYAWLAGRIAHGPVDRTRTDVALASAWWLAALRPVLLLEMLLFQCPARLTAVIRWSLLPAALLFILAVDALAVAGRDDVLLDVADDLCFLFR